MHIIKGFKLRPLGDEFILVGESIELINFNKMITMNEPAAFLWRQVEDGHDFDVDELTQRLLGEYEVSEPQARADAEQMMQAWKNAGIIA